MRGRFALFQTRRTGVALLAVVTLAGCAAPRSGQVGGAPMPVEASPREMAVYPAQGQSARRADRDRYECHLWAVKQSGFDPARSSAQSRAPAPRVEPDPPSGTSTTMGAVAGAVVGAAVANPRRTLEGAAIGAVVGGVAGNAADNAREARAQAIESRMAERRDLPREQRADNYRRATTACLEGRGYTVR
ncbi:glycine zipper 2TM domain-containing protein [Denitromonas ohlonensis]|uniref:Glycine zipper 2TM domain-containing protein n=2 Tax=Denitromonas TaxID=139331 RepID=A0A557SQL0_9RHOO|nr:glycine zipper 2TM domain-containing protein [Denitromonas ohlonensis]TVO66798.1 glycine zipper 2TM domain-containing protein [Denitromonas ohlonensis]TVO79668.1 glycine zipper 2TM domain-containing protein [Denitromonas ohlonensis]